MVLLGIALGFSAFCFFGAVIGEVILHKGEAGLFPGLVVGIWAAWPCFHAWLVERKHFLHPQPREYEIPAKFAFAKIRDFLAEISYNFGDKWRVVTADTQSGRITANLTFTDEVVRCEADAKGQIHTRKERVQRFITLDALVADTGRGTTSVKLDFTAKADGSNLFACDSIISNCQKSISAQLGGAKQADSPAPVSKLSAPPWWLLIISAVALITFYFDIVKGVS
jgi:hypothetical protein